MQVVRLTLEPIKQSRLNVIILRQMIGYWVKWYTVYA